MHEKRQILLDRNSLMSHLKNNGHKENLLLGMSYKQLFELYSMEESDLVNYHASDASPSKNEYTIGLGDDVELGEAEMVYDLTKPDDVKELTGQEKVDLRGKYLHMDQSESRRYDKKTLEEKFSKLAKVKGLEDDKKIVMEMINKQSRPIATKRKIMEYMLNHSK
jgi:hypothetical protein